MPWGVQGALVFLANCSARPRPAAPLCASTRPARCMSGFWIRQVEYGRFVVLPVPKIIDRRFFVFFSSGSQDQIVFQRNALHKRIYRDKIPDMHCMTRVYRDKQASVHWSAARNKERFSSQ